jgi:predicted Zn-dependent protease
VSEIDRIAALKEILAADPKNTLARYGLAMELIRKNEIDAAVAEFDQLLANDPNYTAGYQMAAQTLSTAGRTGEAIVRLKDGIACAQRSGNSHAQSEMQALLDELDR